MTMTSTRGKRAVTTTLSLAVLISLGAGAANAATPVAPAAPGDVTTSIVLSPITPTSPILASPADPTGMSGPYYTSTQTVGGLRYTLPVPAGATGVQVSADYGSGTTWFDDNWQNADYANSLLINGQPFSSYSADQKAANEGSIERIRVVNGVVEITAPMIFADGQQSSLTGYRYTDASGNVVTHNLSITEKAPLNVKSIATPDTATVAPGQTVRSYFLNNDYAGLYPDHYSRDTLGTVSIQDPNTGKLLNVSATPTTVTIAGKGTFTYGIDEAQVKAAYPQSFTANGIFVGDTADYLIAGAFVSFTADPGYTDEVPAIVYYTGGLGENSSATPGDSTGSGSGTTVKGYDPLLAPTTVNADTPNGVRTDFLTLGTCDVSAFSAPTKQVNADGSSTSTFTATNAYGIDWGTSYTTPFTPGDVINTGVTQSPTPDYTPKLTVVNEASGVLTLSYTSPDGADVMPGQNSCVTTPIVRVPNSATSTITFTVSGTPVVPTKPDVPAPVVPETPTGDSANLPVAPEGESVSRPFSNLGGTSASGPVKAQTTASVTQSDDNSGLGIATFIAGGLAMILGSVLALRKKASRVVPIKVRKEQ